MKAFRDSLFVVAFFGGVVLINGILGILLIELFQSIGWWEVQPAGAAEGAAALSGHLARQDLTDTRPPAGKRGSTSSTGIVLGGGDVAAVPRSRPSEAAGQPSQEAAHRSSSPMSYAGRVGFAGDSQA